MALSITSKIILKTNKPGLLIAAFFGSLVGFILALIAIQNYINFQHILNDKDQVIGSQFLVLNKKVSILNSIDIQNSAFSQKQINQLKELPSVKKISVFTPNQFYASAFLELPSEGLNAQLQTDLFLESVDDAFIDVKDEDWKWEEGDDAVPVILPTDFINLYNFTYAPARGLPQISKSTIKLFGFNIIVGSGSDKTNFKGKIIGFSNRISSMLVPNAFMNYANKRFSDKNSDDISAYRLIVEVEPSKLSDFEQFIKEKNFETNQEILRSGKMATLLYAVLYIIFFLGIIMIFNSLSGFILYLRLIITKSKYELENLLRLGYGHQRLTKWYANSIGVLLVVILTFSIISLWYIQKKTSIFMTKYGFSIPQQTDNIVFISALGLISFLYLIFYISIKSQINRMALPTKN